MPPFSGKDDLITAAGFSKYFAAGTWEEYNKQFFDGLAAKYDALNQVLSCSMHLSVKKKAVNNVSIPRRGRVLDICTGSGDIAILIARENPTCRVIGVDVSQNMLAIARKKAQGLTNVEFRTADALRLPFQDRQFDVTFMSFGLRNLADIPRGIQEMKRVTRRGGVVTNLDLGKPNTALTRWLYRTYFETLIPLLGRHVFHRNEFNSFQYLPASNKGFPSPDELMEIFKDSGLIHVRGHNFMLGGISQQIASISA